MKLCVGATSRLAVEVAAEQGVPQIVASRRQVNSDGGYIGLDQRSLVELVRSYTDVTQVVRDHGGPHQNGVQEEHEEWLVELEEDIKAGFDVVHLDVSRVLMSHQYDALAQMLDLVDGRVAYEVGGERDDIVHNMSLALFAAANAKARPVAVVADTGGHVWADRQMGFLLEPAKVGRYEFPLKAHNMDWVGRRRRWEGVVEYMNIAPELGLLETEAWLREMNSMAAHNVLSIGYESRAWTRWFHNDEGTWYSRAVCALRYMQTSSAWDAALTTVPMSGYRRVAMRLAEAMKEWT